MFTVLTMWYWISNWCAPLWRRLYLSLFKFLSYLALGELGSCGIYHLLSASVLVPPLLSSHVACHPRLIFLPLLQCLLSPRWGSMLIITVYVERWNSRLKLLCTSYFILQKLLGYEWSPVHDQFTQWTKQTDWLFENYVDIITDIKT